MHISSQLIVYFVFFTSTFIPFSQKRRITQHELLNKITICLHKGSHWSAVQLNYCGLASSFHTVFRCSTPFPYMPMWKLSLLFEDEFLKPIICIFSTWIHIFNRKYTEIKYKYMKTKPKCMRRRNELLFIMYVYWTD